MDIRWHHLIPLFRYKVSKNFSNTSSSLFLVHGSAHGISTLALAIVSKERLLLIHFLVIWTQLVHFNFLVLSE